MKRLADLATRRPRRVLTATAVFFVIAAAFGGPVFGLLKAGNDFEDPSSESAQARDQLQRAAGTQVDVGLVALVRLGVPVSSPSAAAEVTGIGHTISSDPAVARVVSFYQTHDRALVSHDGASTYIAATFKNLSSTQVENAGTRLQSKLMRIRGVSVGGAALSGPAIGKQVGADIGKAEGLAFPVIFLLTGSVVLPLKSLLMNVLTVSAAFGLLVLIFQDGRLQGLLGYTSQGALEATQPILLFALVFGLSTDYAVFLLSRIKEARDSGLPDNDAVAVGLERTGRIVTAAALLFCVAIGAFATSKVIFIKEVGVGTALAVIIDATIVRALLVPSLMALLGRRNWWAPAPLRRVHDRLALTETPPTIEGEQS